MPKNNSSEKKNTSGTYPPHSPCRVPPFSIHALANADICSSCAVAASVTLEKFESEATVVNKDGVSVVMFPPSLTKQKHVAPSSGGWKYTGECFSISKVFLKASYMKIRAIRQAKLSSVKRVM